MKTYDVLSQLVNTAPRREIANADELDNYKRAKAELDQAAKDNWNDPAWHREQAAVLAETLDYGFQNDNPIAAYFPVQNVGKFDKVTIEQTRGMKVFWTARNGQIDQSRLKTETWELPREALGWHVTEFEDNVQAGYSAAVEKLATYARMREQAEVNRRIFTVLQEAVPSSSPFYEDASVPGLTPQVLNPLISEVADVAPASNVSLAAPLSIIGRAAAIDQITEFSGYADEAKEEIRLTGRLGRYRGANVVRLTNWTDEEDQPYFPEDEVFVLGGDLGRFVRYGGARIRNWTENELPIMHWTSFTEVGLSIWRPQYVRRIKVA